MTKPLPLPTGRPAPRSSGRPSLRPSGLPASAHRERRAPALRSLGEGGFALLVTIILVAFLVLVLVGLATFTRVETQVAANTQSQAQARQNALMALNIALGQLQKHTGPDQRVTATADLQPLAVGAVTDPASATALNTGTPASIQSSIDNFWRASRNRRWVGVWRDPDPARTTLTPDTPALTPATPQLQAWLVSGNESTGATFTPQTQVDNFTLARVASPSAATAIFGPPDQPYRLLLGSGTTSITAAADLDRAVIAPLVPITSVSVPGASDSNPTPIGHYAWWVGDEGVKARANTIDPYADSTDAEEHRTRLQSAQRTAIEVMTGLMPLYPVNDANLSRVISHNQLAQSNEDPDLMAAFKTELTKRYHDITVYSRGVLSDTRNGGLKADLSWMLGQTSESDYLGQLQALYNDNTLTLTSSILGNSATPYVSAPGTNAFVGDFALGLSRSATWAQLRSFFNMGNLPDDIVPGVVDAEGKARPRIQIANTQGINPLLVHAKIFFGLQIDGAGGISVQIRPLVVLANPYDVPLTGDYWVRFHGPGATVRAATIPDGDPVPTPTAALFPTTVYTLGEAQLRRMNLVIRGSEIPPGETRIYSLRQSRVDTGSGAIQEIEMDEGYDPGPSYTLTTNAALGTHTHAVLFATKIVPAARLYGANPAALTGNDNSLLQYVFPYELKLPGTPNSNIFLVYPTAAGETRPGGGGWFVIPDALTTSPQLPQQAYFLQYNPRTLTIFPTGILGNDHPLELAQTYFRNGEAGNDGWFTADLMFDGPGDRVRWGSVTKAATPLSGMAPATVGADTGYTNILYSIPRRDRRLSSIPQLQHLSPSGFFENNRFDSPKSQHYSVLANTFQVNYPTGNSYPNPRVPRDRAYFANVSNSSRTNVAVAYDGSWLYNEVLADRFFFSSYPASDAFDFTNADLINRSMRPFRDQSTTAWNNPLNFRGAPRTAASNLLINGAFNINSTSVEAWKAILSSLRTVPVGGDSSVDVPFSRGLYQKFGYTGSRTANTAGAWAGFHNLSDAEIEDLAKQLVLQIRRRGPFLSLADFMNRRLVAAADDPMGLGLSGALQAAIDAILNQTNDVDPVFRVQSRSNYLAEDAYLARTMTAGAPGYILQADLLAPLAPALSPRSDTFVIRTYGDVANPATGEITSQAWCEAVVQRTPDYVLDAAAGGNNPTEIPAVGSINEAFGRRYQIISFRWLTPADI